MKVLLINPFMLTEPEFSLSRIEHCTADIEEPIGLQSIAAYMRKHMPSIDIDVYDANAYAFAEISKKGVVDMPQLYAMVKEKISYSAPDIVGVSAMFEFCGPESHKITKITKECNPDIVTVMGGAYASFSYIKALADSSLDFIIKGEGEKAFLLLIEYLLGIRSIGEVESLIFRSSDSKISSNPQGSLLSAEDIPTPLRDERLRDLYAKNNKRSIRRFLGEAYDAKVASVVATRGCRYQCAFCSTKELWGRSFRPRAIASVIQEIRNLQELFGVNTIIFNDDAISLDSKWFISFLKELQKLNIRWFGGPQPTHTTQEIIRLCIESGIVLFGINPESGSNETLKKIRKPLNTQMTERFIEMVKSVDKDIYIYASWVVGFPFENMAQIRQTYEFAESLDIDWSAFYCFTPYPGTELYDQCIDQGLIDSNHKVSNVLSFNAINTSSFSSEELLTANYYQNLNLNFLNNRNREKNPDRYVRDMLDMTLNYPNHVFAYYCLSCYYNDSFDHIKGEEYLAKARQAAKNDLFYKPFIYQYNLQNILL